MLESHHNLVLAFVPKWTAYERVYIYILFFYHACLENLNFAHC